ncbi:MAG: segregation and condensation protein [Myxococcales bacterium]|jgi:segregation and condensation protein B|nr:segregation and condensation protein [Myxococcales bacterium]
MKKRKKKSGAASPSSQAGPANDAIGDGPEEITEVNEAPVVAEAQSSASAPADGVVEAAVDAGSDVTISTAAETTQEIPPDLIPVPIDAAHPSHTSDESWDGPTAVSGVDELAALAAKSAEAEGEEKEAPPVDSALRLENIIESLIFASDKPLGLGDLKRLVSERDAKKITAALEALKARHQDTGIQLLGVAGGWQFRTHPENGHWVGKLLAGRPARLSRAMLETLAIVAYRQPITRPEIDEIRGVDCGPVLKTLLDRGLVRMIGKKEDVGRPILYGTTSEFLRTFSLHDLTELPTLREFHELGAAEMAKVDAEAPLPQGETAESTAAAGARTAMPPPTELPPPDPDEEDDLLAELDNATAAAAEAAKVRETEASPGVAPTPETPEA